MDGWCWRGGPRVALVGLWLSAVLDGTGVLPVLAIAVEVLGGAEITLWLIGE